MDSYQNIYGSLLLELTVADVKTRVTSKKFVRAAEAEGAPPQGMMDELEWAIPRDIPQAARGNALNWLVSLYIKGLITSTEYLASIDQESEWSTRLWDDPDTHVVGVRGSSRPPGLSPTAPEDISVVEGWEPSPLTRALETFYQIKELKLDRFLSTSNIEQIPNVASLISIVTAAKPMYDKHIAKKVDEDRTDAEKNSLVYEDHTLRMYIPKTKGAACALSRDTEWCTKSPGLPYYEKYTNPWYVKKFGMKPHKLFIFEWKGDEQIYSPAHPSAEGWVGGEVDKKFQLWYGLEGEEEDDNIRDPYDAPRDADELIDMAKDYLEITLGNRGRSQPLGQFMDIKDNPIKDKDLIRDLTRLVREHAQGLNALEELIVSSILID